MTEPVAERPTAPPDYGYSTDPEGMLPWSRVSEALAAATLYWIPTAQPDGAPHLHSIWGGFVDGHLFFEGGSTTRWARNLATDPRVGFGAESAGLHISGHGRASQAGAGDLFDRVADNYASKYEYRPQDDGFWRIDPDRIVALDMSSLEAFASSPTRFRFEERS